MVTTNEKISIEQFQEKYSAFKRLGQNIVDALKNFLEENKIPFLDIYCRVKTFDSFCEKNERKGYTKPFEEIEDIFILHRVYILHLIITRCSLKSRVFSAGSLAEATTYPVSLTKDRN
ncbi:MAG: hypothetical protein V4557_14450 [Bacteroidota bacterium]